MQKTATAIGIILLIVAVPARQLLLFALTKVPFELVAKRRLLRKLITFLGYIIAIVFPALILGFIVTRF